MCEHSLPLSFSPRLIEYGKTVAKDPRALKKLHTERPMARYKIVDGLGYIYKEDVIKAMQENYFSINVDECTAKNNEKVFTMLVMYFDAERGRSTVQHYKSFSLITATAKVVFNKIVEQFQGMFLVTQNSVTE